MNASLIASFIFSLIFSVSTFAEVETEIKLEEAYNLLEFARASGNNATACPFELRWNTEEGRIYIKIKTNNSSDPEFVIDGSNYTAKAFESAPWVYILLEENVESGTLKPNLGATKTTLIFRGKSDEPTISNIYAYKSNLSSTNYGNLIKPNIRQEWKSDSTFFDCE